MVVQPVGDRLAARGGRGPHPVRLSVVRFARRRRLVAAVPPGRAARRLPAASRDVAARAAGAPARPARARRARRGSLSGGGRAAGLARSEEHTSELQSLAYLVCRLLLEKK